MSQNETFNVDCVMNYLCRETGTKLEKLSFWSAAESEKKNGGKVLLEKAVVRRFFFYIFTVIYTLFFPIVTYHNMAQPKQITQETFDAVVRENIEEFDMDLDEAVQDAKEQFKTQGVDLSNLITSFVKDPDTGDLKHNNPVKGKIAEILHNCVGFLGVFTLDA